MQLIGRSSRPIGAFVHVGKGASHARREIRISVSGASDAFQLGSQPLPPIAGCAPDPAAGAFAAVPAPADTNARKRPTVTSKRSSRNGLTDAGADASGARANVPPGTRGLSQHSWEAAGPQRASAPGARAAQLAGSPASRRAGVPVNPSRSVVSRQPATPSAASPHQRARGVTPIEYGIARARGTYTARGSRLD